jgi:hypothetical protein
MPKIAIRKTGATRSPGRVAKRVKRLPKINSLDFKFLEILDFMTGIREIDGKDTAFRPRTLKIAVNGPDFTGLAVMKIIGFKLFYLFLITSAH